MKQRGSYSSVMPLPLPWMYCYGSINESSKNLSLLILGGVKCLFWVPVRFSISVACKTELTSKSWSEVSHPA